MNLHKILLPNEQQHDNSNNNKIPAPRDKWRQGWIVIFFGPDREWEGNWEIFCRNIKEFYWLTTPPPPRSHLPCYSNYKRSHLCSVILPLFFFFSGWMWCYRVWAFKELCSSRNCWKREWHGSFHFHFFFSGMFRHFVFWTIFVCRF